MPWEGQSCLVSIGEHIHEVHVLFTLAASADLQGSLHVFVHVACRENSMKGSKT